MSILSQFRFKKNHKSQSTVKFFEGHQIIFSHDSVIVDCQKIPRTETPNITINVYGNADEVFTISGNIEIKNNALNVVTSSGSVKCKTVLGSIETNSGDVSCKKVGGSIRTKSGDIYKSIF